MLHFFSTDRALGDFARRTCRTHRDLLDRLGARVPRGRRLCGLRLQSEHHMSFLAGGQLQAGALREPVRRRDRDVNVAGWEPQHAPRTVDLRRRGVLDAALVAYGDVGPGNGCVARQSRDSAAQPGRRLGERVPKLDAGRDRGRVSRRRLEDELPRGLSRGLVEAVFAGLDDGRADHVPSRVDLENQDDRDISCYVLTKGLLGIRRARIDLQAGADDGRAVRGGELLGVRAWSRKGQDQCEPDRDRGPFASRAALLGSPALRADAGKSEHQKRASSTSLRTVRQFQSAEAKPSHVGWCSESRAAEIFTASGLLSTSTNPLPCRAAASPLVPLPPKKSRTTSPGCE